MPLTVDLAQILNAARAATEAGLHVCLPGVVEAYNPLTQSASIKPTVRNPITDLDTDEQDTEDPPTIPNVMIVYPRGGGFHLYFPLQPGDHVVLVFSDLATGQWRETGEVSEPLDLRRHSLGYPFAIPGAFPVAQTLVDPVNPLYRGKMVIGMDGDPTSSIRIGSGTVECGGPLPLPLAMAPPTVIAFAAIATYIAALTAALAANPLPPQYATFVAAMAGPGATLATALGLVAADVPATITKGQ